ncbi:N-acetylmuramic acid 6-phosphate etherase [Paenibacillus beijingensis]|uniref:N-acetylmuramic acid 6-phosphate etherase n=1 Tax=Paenibacillus beijingensis TaxID=1126833 RepID=A0A0D5NKW0_9BACL|nr:N-acetylmuramic acid 6-phosphate etherase [Paenibacillus beijingensis]AJY75573.1 N-acetylmuramic acid-6-phosphate etherase [Paenibacillus beijingensis]
MNMLSLLTTEQPNANTYNIDQMNAEQIMYLINEEDRHIAEHVRAVIPKVAAAAELVVEAFRKGGRLFYIGAGTSGRLGILDASECPPTFGTDPSMVQGLIAGGFRAMKEPIEGAEDSPEMGAKEVEEHGIGANDVLVGIAASGRTPYVLGAMKRAGELGAVVIGLCNNTDTPMKQYAQLVIDPVVGPEVVLGSTRMKAGTSQKLILNMLTTTSMILMGKVYQNLMVDLNPSNEKLVYRAKRIIHMATGADDVQVEQAFAAADGHVKTAIVMLLTGTGADEAKALLSRSGGFVRSAVELTGSGT